MVHYSVYSGASAVILNKHWYIKVYCKHEELNFMPVVLTGYWQVFNNYTTKTATDVTSWLGYKMARPSKFINGILSRANINTVFFHYNLKKLLFDNFLKWSHLLMN